jgi:hypothetical protein
VSEDSLPALEAQMARAVEAEDYEAAAALRDRIAALKAESGVRRPPPGEMGLGTERPRHIPPEGWVRPAKPDPMTRGSRPGGRRRK